MACQSVPVEHEAEYWNWAPVGLGRWRRWSPSSTTVWKYTVVGWVYSGNKATFTRSEPGAVSAPWQGQSLNSWFSLLGSRRGLCFCCPSTKCDSWTTHQTTIRAVMLLLKGAQNACAMRDWKDHFPVNTPLPAEQSRKDNNDSELGVVWILTRLHQSTTDLLQGRGSWFGYRWRKQVKDWLSFYRCCL